MIFTLFLLLFLICMAVVSYLIKLRKLREIQTVFVRYNDTGNPEVLKDWIEEKAPEQRMVRTLDYLEKIEDEALAVKIYASFEPSRFKHRHTRIFACKAHAKTGNREQALQMARDLLESYPGDDAILELFLEVHLDLEEYEPARKMLEARMLNKFKGTVFTRCKARLLAADGAFEEAVKIMEDVTKRDHILYVNTFAQPQKRLIYEQYVVSQKLLDRFKALLEGRTPENG